MAGTGETAKDSTAVSCGIKWTRLGGYRFISPLVAVDARCESPRFSRLKAEIASYLAAENNQAVSRASVYLWGFADGDWMAINPDRRYEPGSLLKVGVLITYLKMAEKSPGLLGSSMVYHGRPGFVFPVEHYRSGTVVEGRRYTVKELLQSMIVHSDNRATLFLENYMDTTLFKDVFSDQGIARPSYQQDYLVDARSYGTLFKTLFNASYLSRESSEYALALLAQSEFRQGLLKDLPSVIAAHKFGESGDAVTHQLHEAGIVYLGNYSYLLTVMTQGNDWDSLSSVIGHVSRMVYDNMSDTSNRYNTNME